MSGSYPDAPGPRMVYDRDATEVMSHNGAAAPTVLTEPQKQKLNDETSGGDYALPAGHTYLAFVFPTLRDISGVGIKVGDAGNYILQKSVDTTNGLDGTWVNAESSYSNTTFDPVGTGHRTTIRSVSHPGVKGIRFSISGLGADRTVYGVHLYGAIDSGATDRLTFLDSLGNPITGATFDWGDVPRGSSADRQFQVKNLSATKTAQNVVVQLNSLTDTAPSVEGQHYLSLDGVTFTATVTIPSLAPGATQLVTLRRVTPSNASLSVWDTRLIAAPTVFS